MLVRRVLEEEVLVWGLPRASLGTVKLGFLWVGVAWPVCRAQGSWEHWEKTVDKGLAQLWRWGEPGGKTEEALLFFFVFL